MRRISLLFVCVFAPFAMCVAAETPAPEPPAPSADGTMPALVSIAGHGMMDAHPYADLEELSDMIGGRVTGSPEAAKAVEWGMARMKAIGLENVRAEKWQLSRGWTRGFAGAEIVEPIQRKLNIDSMGWVGSTTKNGVDRGNCAGEHQRSEWRDESQLRQVGGQGADCSSRRASRHGTEWPYI